MCLFLWAAGGHRERETVKSMVPTQIRIYFCGCKKSQHVILEIRESPILKLLSKNWKHPSCHGGSSTSLMRLYLTSCAFAYCYIIFFVRAIPWSVMNCKKTWIVQQKRDDSRQAFGVVSPRRARVSLSERESHPKTGSISKNIGLHKRRLRIQIVRAP